MKKLLLASLIALINGSCQNNSPPIPSPKKEVFFNPSSKGDEKTIQTFKILSMDPGNLVYSEKLISAIHDETKNKNESQKTLSEGISTFKVASEFIRWVDSRPCGIESIPTLPDHSEKASIVIASQCISLKFKKPFEALESGMMSFKVSPFQSKRARYLSLNDSLPFHENPNFKYLEIPLEDSGLRFVLILPAHPEDPMKSFNQLSLLEIRESLEKLEPKRIHLEVPSFNLHLLSPAEKALKLDPNLESMKTGKKRTRLYSFVPFRMGISGINQIDKPSEKQERPLSIDGLFRTKIQFNQPFVFVVENRTTREMLVLGKVYEP